MHIHIWVGGRNVFVHTQRKICLFVVAFDRIDLFHFFSILLLWMILFFLNCKHAADKQSLYPVLLIYIFMDTYKPIFCYVSISAHILLGRSSFVCLYLDFDFIYYLKFLGLIWGLFLVRKFNFHPFIYFCVFSFGMTKFTNVITTTRNVINFELPTFLSIDIFTIWYIGVCLSTNRDILRFVVIYVKRCLSLLYIIKIIFRFHMTGSYLKRISQYRLWFVKYCFAQIQIYVRRYWTVLRPTKKRLKMKFWYFDIWSVFGKCLGPERFLIYLEYS